MTFEQRYVQARRRFIEADFANLNDMQRKAVLATEGPLLLLAGAGSGKTTVLIHRIANLIQYGRGSDTDEVPDTATEADLALLERTDLTPDERRRAQRAAALEPVEPWRIIAITFTNKAADELKDRIERMLGPEAAADIWASTFHSACVRILRRDADKLGYPNSFTIYDTSDSQAVVKRILKEMNLDEKAFPYRAVLTEISRAKDSGITPEQYLARAQATHNPRSIRIGEVYQTYWQRLFSAGAMDFDDLIYNTVRLLDEHEDVREHWQRRFRYVLIDEYQDTNNLQYQLAALLADGWGNICVVGDDDQSIYKFRGATIENILNFEKQYKNARTIRLEQNYRSTGRILDAANHVIANNTGRKGKTLWTKAEAGDPLTLYCATNENDEARYVATKIMDDFGHGMNFRDHAVLYRMNAQSNQLEYAFKRNGINWEFERTGDGRNSWVGSAGGHSREQYRVTLDPDNENKASFECTRNGRPVASAEVDATQGPELWKTGSDGSKEFYNEMKAEGAAFAAAPGMVLEAAIDRGCFISENKKKIDPKQAAAAEKNAALLSEALGNSRAASPESPVGQTKAAKKIAESKMQPSMPARNEGMHR